MVLKEVFPSLWLLYGGSFGGREVFGFVYEFSDYVGLTHTKKGKWLKCVQVGL